MPKQAAPTLLPDADPILVEFYNNLLRAAQFKTVKTSEEVLLKVQCLKYIQECSVMSALAAFAAQQQQQQQSSSDEPSCSSAGESSSFDMDTSEPDDQETPQSSFSDTPVFFNSMTAVLNNLNQTGVDPIVAEGITLDRLSSASANPLSFIAGAVLKARGIKVIDDFTMLFIKSVLKRLHDHENFSVDGAPYPYDVKSALRYSEHLHSLIPPLETINPPHLAHEQSITFTAMARFMAMHEINIDFKILFPVNTNVLDEHAYYSSIFWTYREAMKKFYYPQMPAPLPKKFQMEPADRQMLCRYWNAGNRHATASECILLSKRCTGLAPFQVAGFFDKRRRREYNRYRGTKDEETLALETAHVWRKLTEMGQHVDDEDDDCDDDTMIQREFLTKEETAKLDFMWRIGHRKPSRNESEILAAELGMNSGDQIFAYFEDRRWHEEYQARKHRASSSRRSS